MLDIDDLKRQISELKEKIDNKIVTVDEATKYKHLIEILKYADLLMKERIISETFKVEERRIFKDLLDEKALLIVELSKIEEELHETNAQLDTDKLLSPEIRELLNRQYEINQRLKSIEYEIRNAKKSITEGIVGEGANHQYTKAMGLIIDSNPYLRNAGSNLKILTDGTHINKPLLEVAMDIINSNPKDYQALSHIKVGKNKISQDYDTIKLLQMLESLVLALEYNLGKYEEKLEEVKTLNDSNISLLKPITRYRTLNKKNITMNSLEKYERNVNELIKPVRFCINEILKMGRLNQSANLRYASIEINGKTINIPRLMVLLNPHFIDHLISLLVDDIKELEYNIVLTHKLLPKKLKNLDIEPLILIKETVDKKISISELYETLSRLILLEQIKTSEDKICLDDEITKEVIIKVLEGKQNEGEKSLVI